MRFLFVDRIVHSSPGVSIRGIKHITSDDFYLTADEEGKACFIPSLIGEVLGQLAAWNVMQVNEFSLRPVAGVVSSARLHRNAYLGETLLLESFIDALDDQVVEYHSQAKIGEEVVFTIEGALGPLLPMEDFISKEVVTGQFRELYRPGDWPLIRAEAAMSGIITCVPPSTQSMTFDRILACEPGVSMIGQKRLTRAASYFPDHFPNKPVMPLTVLLECKLNLAKSFIREAAFSFDYRLREFRKIKMNGFVCPGDVLTTYVKVKEQNEKELILSYRSEVEGKRVCVVEVVFASIETIENKP